jgi:hypothetical protein
MIEIHEFLPNAQCDFSSRKGEAVEISTADGSIQHAVISLPQLAKLLRFRYRQQQRQEERESGASAGKLTPPSDT